MNFPVRLLSLIGLILIFAIAGYSADKVAQGSGAWNTIIWSPAGTPVAADLVHIGNSFSVNYTTGASPSFNRVLVGDGTAGAADGTLEVSGGTLTVNASAAGAYQAGTAAGATGTINVTGGTLRTTSASAGGMQIGWGGNSQGYLNISSGAITLTGGVSLGAASTATGHMSVSGGTVTTSSGTSAANFLVGNRVTGTTTGIYEQTGGTVTINNNSSYFGVGHAGSSGQDITGTARITGGNFSGNVRVGRQSDVLSGGGSGTLTIGPAALVTGRNAAWEVSGTGEIVFELGSTPTFNAVDLTMVTASNALVFSQAGAQITIDGSNLAFSEGLSPVTFITFAEGKGPSAASLSNVDYNFTGFAAGFDPALFWDNTALILNLYAAIPEPSTYAAIFAMVALGLAVVRRRRRQLVKIP